MFSVEGCRQKSNVERSTVKDTDFPVKGQKTSNPGQIQDTVKSRTGPRNKGLYWIIRDGWSPYLPLSQRACLSPFVSWWLRGAVKRRRRESCGVEGTERVGCGEWVSPPYWGRVQPLPRNFLEFWLKNGTFWCILGILVSLLVSMWALGTDSFYIFWRRI